MILRLWRHWRSEHSIIGVHQLPNGLDPVFTLELPWKDNQKNISCIPAGPYRCIRGISTKNREWGEAFFVQNVPGGRTAIIDGHIANKPEELLGCSAFGTYYDREDHILYSSRAIDRWMKAMEGIDEYTLEIIEYF